MALLVRGLSQEYVFAKNALTMLRWLCKGQDVPASTQATNLTLLCQMKGLHRLSALLCTYLSPGSAGTQLAAMGKSLAVMQA